MAETPDEVTQLYRSELDRVELMPVDVSVPGLEDPCLPALLDHAMPGVTSSYRVVSPKCGELTLIDAATGSALRVQRSWDHVTRCSGTRIAAIGRRDLWTDLCGHLAAAFRSRLSDLAHG